MAESEVERQKHETGGPGKASKKESPHPEKRTNKPGQKETPKERGQGKGGVRDVPEDKRRPAG